MESNMKIYKYIIFLILTTFSLFAQTSRIDLVTINSQVLAINKNFNIYLPVGYDSSNQRYPVVYFFRGHEREWVNRNEDGSRLGRNIQDIADLLYQNGDIGEMILVMPGVTSSDNTVHGLGINMVNVGLAGGSPGLGTGQFEDYLLNELIPYVDTHFRTLPTRTQRATDGFSLGGFTSMMMATKHPDLFISAGSYDGTLMWLDFDDLRSPGTWDDFWLTTAFADPAFGFPRDTTVMFSYNSSNLLFYADTTNLLLIQDIQFLIHTVGAVHGGNSDLAQHFVNLLNGHGIQNSFADIRLAPIAIHNWWYADEHALTTLPLHWQKFQNTNVTSFAMQLLSPTHGSEISGNAEIRWSPNIPDSSVFTIIDYSRDGGKYWNYLTELSAIDTTYLWNTTNFPDGTRYLLRVRTIGDTIFGEIQSQGRFNINNPGNGIPDLELFSPSAGEIVSGDFNINWFGDDADGDTLSFFMEYSSNNGINWSNLFNGLNDSLNFMWNSVYFQNSSNYMLALLCSDGAVTISDTSEIFEVFNQRITSNDSTAIHVSGIGSGSVSINIVDPDSLTSDSYQITFDDSTFSNTVYNVENISTNNLVVQNAIELNGNTEGPSFEGLRLIIKDYENAEVDTDNSGWQIGNSDLEINIHLPVIDLGGGNILNGFPYSADYKITLFDHIVDTSSNTWGALTIPVYFTVFNETGNYPAEFILLDTDNNNTISRLDELYIIETDSIGGPLLTWAFAFGGQPSAINPVPGDEYLFNTLKPFTHEDIFEFSNVTSIEPLTATSPKKFILYQNYPNPFNPTTMIKYYLPNTQRIELSVYNILGQKIQTLVNGFQTAGSKSIIWDGKNYQGKSVSSGIYFYRIQSGDIIINRKMILMK
jgi:S-formylglutathione hydrolase FrmB